MDLVKILIAHGADVDSTTSLNVTPLQWAARNDRIDVVRALLDANANIGARDNYELTAIDWAVQNSKHHTIPIE